VAEEPPAILDLLGQDCVSDPSMILERSLVLTFAVLCWTSQHCLRNRCEHIFQLKTCQNAGLCTKIFNKKNMR